MNRREEFRTLVERNDGTLNLLSKVFLSLGLFFIVLIAFIACSLLAFRPEEFRRFMYEPIVVGMVIFSMVSIVLAGPVLLYKKRKRVR